MEREVGIGGGEKNLLGEWDHPLLTLLQQHNRVNWCTMLIDLKLLGASNMVFSFYF